MKKLLLVALLGFTFLQANSQSITIDLSQNLGSTITQTIGPKTISAIVLQNRCIAPSVVYNITTVIKHQNPATINIPGLPAAGGGAAQNLIAQRDQPQASSPCDSLDADNNKLQNETDETKLAPEIKKIQSDIKRMSTANQVTCAAKISAGQSLISSVTNDTHQLTIALVIGVGDELDVTITSGNKTWNYNFVTTQTSHWTVFYGLTYVPDILTNFPNY